MEIDPLKKMGWENAGIQGNAIVTGREIASGKRKPTDESADSQAGEESGKPEEPRQQQQGE